MGPPVKLLAALLANQGKKLGSFQPQDICWFSLILMLQYIVFQHLVRIKTFGVDRSSLWFTAYAYLTSRVDFSKKESEIRPTHHQGWQSDEYHLWESCILHQSLFLDFFVELEKRLINYSTTVFNANWTWRMHIVWKSLKMSHLNFLILAFSTNFCPIKTDMSGNTVWPQASGFQKLAKMEHFWHF